MVKVGAPGALAVTGENGGDDLVTTLVSGGIVAGLYLFVIPVSHFHSHVWIQLENELGIKIRLNGT